MEATPAFRIVGGRAASLHVELPFAGILSQEVRAVEFPSLRNQLYALFLTPAANIRVLPSAPVSPWFSVGGGWARYGSAQNKGALEYGGGLDIKTGISRLAVRAEVRDFVTGTPDPNVFFLISPVAARRHNILLGGGVVVRLP